MRTSPSDSRRLARWTASLTTLLALLLVGAPSAALAQADSLADEAAALEREAFDDLDRQLDGDALDSAKPNTELWEEYQRYADREDGNGSGYRTSAERVEIGGNITIQEDEVIAGDVVAVGGRVTVYGKVEGDAVAVGGDVILGEGARVEGDAVAVGGKVRETGDAEVLGERVSVDIPIPIPFGGEWDVNWHGFEMGKPSWVGFSFEVAFFVVGLLVSLLLYALAGRRLDVVSRRVDEEPGQSFLIGLLGACATPFALIVASILLAVTIIGVLLIPVLLIVVFVMALGGFVAVSLTVGRRIVAARSRGDSLQPSRGPYFHILIGFLALYALDFLSSLLSLGGAVLTPFALLFGVIGAFVLIFASILGYGAIMISRFGTEPTPAVAATAVVGTLPPPPPPPARPAPTGPPAPERPAPPAPPPAPPPDSAGPEASGEKPPA